MTERRYTVQKRVKLEETDADLLDAYARLHGVPAGVLLRSIVKQHLRAPQVLKDLKLNDEPGRGDHDASIHQLFAGRERRRNAGDRRQAQWPQHRRRG